MASIELDDLIVQGSIEEIALNPNSEDDGTDLVIHVALFYKPIRI